MPLNEVCFFPNQYTNQNTFDDMAMHGLSVISALNDVVSGCVTGWVRGGCDFGNYALDVSVVSLSLLFYD